MAYEVSTKVSVAATLIREENRRRPEAEGKIFPWIPALEVEKNGEDLVTADDKFLSDVNGIIGQSIP